MEAAVLVNEFKSSMSKAIRSLSKNSGIPEAEVQICFQLNEGNGSVYSLYRSFKYVKALSVKDILFLPFIYAAFKGKVEKEINKLLLAIADKSGVGRTRIAVFVQRGKASADAVRMMLYENGTYAKDISETYIIELIK